MDRDTDTTHMSKEKKRQQEGKATPHPGLEALCGGKAGGHRITRDKKRHHSDTAPEERTSLHSSPSGSTVACHAPLTHSEVHGVPLAQGPQPVQTATLVVILEELHKAWGEGC